MINDPNDCTHGSMKNNLRAAARRSALHKAKRPVTHVSHRALPKMGCPELTGPPCLLINLFCLGFSCVMLKGLSARTSDHIEPTLTECAKGFQ